MFSLGDKADGATRLMTASGLMATIEGDTAILEEPMPGTPLSSTLLAFDFYGDDPVKVERVEVPTACALFPKELLAWPPRSYVERIYNIQHWTEMPRGGHFGALEEPELLIEDIRDFVRDLSWD